MKNLIVLFFASCLISIQSIAQTLIKNEIDKFTKVVTVETSSEVLCRKTVPGAGAHQVVISILKKGDNNIQLLANLGTTTCEKYTEDDGISLLLENDEVVTLRTNFIGVSGPFRVLRPFTPGSHFFDTGFTLSKEDVELLGKYRVVEARINYLGGHQDMTIKKPKQNLLKNMLSLINN